MKHIVWGTSDQTNINGSKETENGLKCTLNKNLKNKTNKTPAT